VDVTVLVTVQGARTLHRHPDPARVPLMGVLGAFVFAAQMVNFSIPATGSSGHLGGGLLLAILLGPEAAFLVIASVLTVQALFFADGGLLALGANIFNLGVFPAFVADHLIYRRIVGERPCPSRVVVGSIAGALVGLSLGALAVVLETSFSGISALPFGTFLALMLPIHLAIGLVEGLVTAAVVLCIARLQPEVLSRAAGRQPLGGLALRRGCTSPPAMRRTTSPRC
jgi:cobalt/nickel transport system permease protein